MPYTPPALNAVNFALTAFTPALTYMVNFEVGTPKIHYPSSADVKKDVVYGPRGVEYTGTLAGSSGLAAGSVLFNVESGEPYIYIGNPLILKA